MMRRIKRVERERKYRQWSLTAKFWFGAGGRSRLGWEILDWDMFCTEGEVKIENIN
jgi:hypothetical protein